MSRGPKNLQIAFTGRRLTHFGGVYLLYLFLRRLRFKSAIGKELFFVQQNNRYTIAEEMLALMYPISLGIGRIEATYLLKHNGVFQYLTGLPTYPNPTTLRRFLLRMAPLALSKLRTFHDKLLAVMAMQPTPPRRVVFDLDSTVLQLYGRQEMARIGYNPVRRGRPSYQPLLCFNGITKDFWHGELRPGDTHTATGALELLDAAFAKLPPSAKSIIVRADKGFFDRKIIEHLESKNTSFVIVARLTKPIKERLSSLAYRHYLSGAEAAEFRYQPTRWKQPYRFIVLRRPLPRDPTEQLSLFSMGRYSYQVIVTNMKLNPLNTWKLYNGRASIELIIKELKADYPLAKIPTRDFAANEAYFHILLLSYNLINWFKRLCLPKEFHMITLNTLRSRLLLIPGELIRSGNRPILKLAANFPYKNAFEHAIRKIQSLKI